MQSRHPTFGNVSGPERFAWLRRQMVDEQLRARDIIDPRVLAAMSHVPREEFVLPAMRESAYEDCPLPIGFGQTISQPFTVAFMAEAAGLQGHETVLEIGAGSGYGAAVLEQLARQVYTLERIEPLAEQARERLQRLGCHRVTVCYADGALGYADAAPYEAIVVTAGAESLPTIYLDQLSEGGRLIIPLGSRRGSQTMFRIIKLHGSLSVDDLGPFAFVPLIEGRKSAE